MKNILSTIAMTAILLFAALPLSAKNLSTSTTTEKITNSRIVENLLVGLKSHNEGLKLSSLFYLGNYDTENSVIELMRTLKDDSKEEARITAALSLFKLGDARGIYAVKRAAVYDESARVRKMCDNYYREFITQKN